MNTITRFTAELKKLIEFIKEMPRAASYAMQR